MVVMVRLDLLKLEEKEPQMTVISSIIALLIIVMIHELGHAYAMIRKGIRIKEMGLGLHIPSLPIFILD